MAERATLPESFLRMRSTAEPAGVLPRSCPDTTSRWPEESPLWHVDVNANASMNMSVPNPDAPVMETKLKWKVCVRHGASDTGSREAIDPGEERPFRPDQGSTTLRKKTTTHDNNNNNNNNNNTSRRTI